MPCTISARVSPAPAPIIEHAFDWPRSRAPCSVSRTPHAAPNIQPLPDLHEIGIGLRISIWKSTDSISNKETEIKS